MKTIEKFKTTKTKLFLICCGVAILMTYGCSKNNPLNPVGNCFDGNWAETYTNELQTWSNAATAYADNPTPANCANYKNAAKGYINAIDDFYNCIPTASKAEIDEALKEAKAEIDSESCD